MGLKLFNHLYLLEKELIALQKVSHEINIFHFNLRFVQNVIQTKKNFTFYKVLYETKLPVSWGLSWK